jgi:hypothetical protein
MPRKIISKAQRRHQVLASSYITLIFHVLMYKYAAKFLTARDEQYKMRSSCVVRASANAVVATVLGSIPAFSDTVESEGRQTKQCWISYIKRKKSNQIKIRSKKRIYSFPFCTHFCLLGKEGLKVRQFGGAARRWRRGDGGAGVVQSSSPMRVGED